ncbi:hypothetical protein BAE44_0013275 [Dichanthelium oligosanthes]|uniref:DUF4220 domain-containing protein n=1 Tax=Dichanthelium oligosanthes TaxID=888268 RepID=A0A1E5VKS4_9POAL|nr:hypothetical protein BAE44_0013275 [Dichanthelium oligosanthes]
MGFAEGEQWWEAWQLRVLVLGSLFLQFFLIVAAALRRRRTPHWFRFLTWAAYQGSDALAIYALATLFNRRLKQNPVSPTAPRRGAGLEALWAPILLLHLGGQDGITAYSIQDSELWQRHFVISASQIVVAIYVFRKSWPRGDKRLLEAAILLFIPGILKCLEKPFALWRASISSMAVAVGSRACRIDDDDGDGDDMAKMEEDVSLAEFLKQAASAYDSAITQQRVSASGHKVKDDPYRLFVDIPYPFSIRLANVRYMSKKRDEAHQRVQSGLSKAFNRLYTNYKGYPGAVLRAVLVVLTLVAIRLFNMRRRAYADADRRVTYILLSSTAALECISAITMARCRMMSRPPWPDQVAQCNLLWYVARGKKHKKLRTLASWMGCEGYLHRLWCTVPPRRSSPPSPAGITELVHDHISTQWREHIKYDVSAYRRFSNSRGQWTLEKEGFGSESRLASSLKRPFDESVVLWHLATDFCFFSLVGDGSNENRRCREISNYMVYLLLVSPEMLMPGARCRILWSTYDRVRNTFGGNHPKDAEDLARKTIQRVKTGTNASGLFHDAWALAHELMEDGKKSDDGEVKMWRVIRGVWVEMLCFAAGRCSGYLHAKSLGTGGEFLSYVWLLREYMGMETLADTMQRPSDSASPELGTGQSSLDSSSQALAEGPASNSVSPEPPAGQLHIESLTSVKDKVAESHKPFPSSASCSLRNNKDAGGVVQTTTSSTGTTYSNKNLLQQLPAGAVLAFQTLAATFTNQGRCLRANLYLTAGLVAFLGATCIFFSFTDTVRDGATGKLHKGVALPGRLYIVNLTKEEQKVMSAELKKHGLKYVDWVHAILTLVVFLTIAGNDVGLQNCFFPSATDDTRQLLRNLPLGMAVMASFLFMIFPTTRSGISFDKAAALQPLPPPPPPPPAQAQQNNDPMPAKADDPSKEAKADDPSTAAKATERVLTSSANLLQLLPTGPVLAFQTLSASFTNQGKCYNSNKWLTVGLVTFLSATCIFSSFTDTVKDSKGRVHKGVAVSRRLHIFNLSKKEQAAMKAELRKRRLKTLDWVHALFTAVVFLTIAGSDVGLQDCFFPKASDDTKQLLKNLPLGMAVMSSFVFVIFPATRKGIGFDDSDYTVIETTPQATSGDAENPTPSSKPPSGRGMGFAEAEQWWERWQLRVLVLGSLFLQFFLFLSAALRKRRTPPWFRFLTWAAYLVSDFLAIYALATLFNRHRKQLPDGASPSPLPHSSAGLEVLWAPILLFHLGGQDGITAYSIQDNELWRRHFLIATLVLLDMEILALFRRMCQVVIAIYVFRKSWQTGGDKRLLLAAILLFFPGILKCLEKPWALRRSSINSMAVTVAMRSRPRDSKILTILRSLCPHRFMPTPEDDDTVKLHHPYHLFVDLPHPYSVDLDKKQGATGAHLLVRSGLSRTFDRLYTNYKGYPGGLVRAVLLVLTLVAILLFTTVSRRGVYDDTDLKVTYVLLSCTAGLEVISAITMAWFRMMSNPPWPDQVAQCNLIGYLVHSEEHQWHRRLASLLGYQGYLDWLWCTAPSRSPAPPPDRITALIHTHITDNWKSPDPAIADDVSKEHTKEDEAACRRRFSNSRGQWTLDKEGCGSKTSLVSSLQRPFDESVIIWHLATDFCFFHHIDSGSENNRRCREISNYMAYLLLVNPEMLMPGARRRIFMVAYAQVREILVKDEPPEYEDDLAKKKVPLGRTEDIARMVIQKVKAMDQPPEDKDDSAKKEEVQPGAKDDIVARKIMSRSCLVQDAWVVARELMGLGRDSDGEEKMWRVLRGIWVEMLCFSASRCRGYRHAKSLGTGGEYLSYVWLLRAYMGMETLAHRIQTTEEGDLGPVEEEPPAEPIGEELI